MLLNQSTDGNVEDTTYHQLQISSEGALMLHQQQQQQTRLPTAATTAGPAGIAQSWGWNLLRDGGHDQQSPASLAQRADDPHGLHGRAVRAA